MDAIKPYSIGDVIYKSSPLVYVTVKNKRGIICDYCMKELVNHVKHDVEI